MQKWDETTAAYVYVGSQTRLKRSAFPDAVDSHTSCWINLKIVAERLLREISKSDNYKKAEINSNN